MRNNIVMYSLPFLVLALTVTNMVYASEVLGNLSSAGVNNLTNNSGSISGTVTAGSESGTLVGNVVSGVVSSGGGGGGGGGSMVIDTSGLYSIGQNTSLAYNDIPLTSNTIGNSFVAPPVYRAPASNITKTNYSGKSLSVGGEDFSIPPTDELAQGINIPSPIIEVTQVDGGSGFWGLSYGAWILLFVLIILAMIVYNYLRDEKNISNNY